MFQIVNPSSSYPTVILATRNVDCSEILEEEFVDAIREDIEEAVASYNEVSVPLQIKQSKEFDEKYMNREIERARTYASYKWKTEKRQNKYLDEVIPEIEKKYSNRKPTIYSLGFFDFDGNCGTAMGISCGCIIDIDDNLTDERLANCFEILVKSKYFNKAIGWQVCYEGDTKTYHSCFRPKIKLIFDEETTKEIEAAKKALSDSVNSFYTNTTYYGD